MERVLPGEACLEGAEEVSKLDECDFSLTVVAIMMIFLNFWKIL
jgi:hypothetical protein